MLLEHLRELWRSDRDQRAISWLRNPLVFPGLKNLTSMQPMLQLCIVPSFHPITTWTVYSNFRDKGHYRVRRIRWDRQSDQELQNGEPTLFGCDADIAAPDIDPSLETLRSLELPIFRPPASGGLDGVSYEVRTLDFYLSSSLQWWQKVPPGFEALGIWFENFASLLESHLVSNLPS